MSTIVSIDVGVVNLAICILRRPGNELNRQCIDFWRLYDVSLTKTPRKRAVKSKDGPCCARLRGRRGACGKMGSIQESGKILCGVHDPARKHTASDTQDWTHGMLMALPQIGADIDAVVQESPLRIVIERQSIKNEKMLLQSHVIYGFFVQRYKNTVPVSFVPAYNKLKCYKGPDITCNLKGAYARRKYLARKHTEYFLNGREELAIWAPFFTSAKKKQDDLADSFLQGLFYLLD